MSFYVMQAARRKFIKNSGLLVATAAVGGMGVIRFVSSASSSFVRVVPVEGEFYGPAMLTLMKEGRFENPQAALRAVKNQRVRFALELTAA